MRVDFFHQTITHERSQLHVIQPRLEFDRATLGTYGGSPLVATFDRPPVRPLAANRPRPRLPPTDVKWNVI